MKSNKTAAKKKKKVVNTHGKTTTTTTTNHCKQSTSKRGLWYTKTNYEQDRQGETTCIAYLVKRAKGSNHSV